MPPPLSQPSDRALDDSPSGITQGGGGNRLRLVSRTVFLGFVHVVAFSFTFYFIFKSDLRADIHLLFMHACMS